MESDKKIKAIWVEKPGGLDNLELKEIPRPEPDSKQVRIRIETAGVSRPDITVNINIYLIHCKTAKRGTFQMLEFGIKTKAPIFLLCLFFVPKLKVCEFAVQEA